MARSSDADAIKGKIVSDTSTVPRWQVHKATNDVTEGARVWSRACPNMDSGRHNWKRHKPQTSRDRSCVWGSPQSCTPPHGNLRSSII